MPKQLLDCEPTGGFCKDNCENDSKEKENSFFGQRDIVMRVNRPTWQSIISNGVTYYEAYGFLWYECIEIQTKIKG